ncbi:MAG: alpha/beta fold hydrolase [Planctomycetaceae bacterium]|nr:alpha/beta fold hydrolase [Planctomycetaceae bacterium]
MNPQIKVYWKTLCNYTWQIAKHIRPTYLVILFVIVGVISYSLGGCAPNPVTPPSPTTIKNNTWYRRPPDLSATNVIFLHGIFSSSQTCWQNPDTKAFWPQLLAKDATFNNCGIFLAGYDTEFESGAFEMINAVKQLQVNFSDQKNNGESSPLDAPEILFVAHSTGGILVREYLTRHYGEFKNKKVGLVLLASPALGSSYADWLGFVADGYGNKMATQLRKTNPNLENLDDRFREQLETLPEQRGYCLQGVEYLENHFVSRKGELLLRMQQIVKQSDVGRYFGTARIVPGTNHFSIAAPASDEAQGYKYVRTWYTDTFRKVECKLSEAPEPEVGPPKIDDLMKLAVPSMSVAGMALLTDVDRKKQGYSESLNCITNQTPWNLELAYRFLPKDQSEKDGLATVVVKDIYAKLEDKEDIQQGFGGPVYLAVRHRGKWYPTRWYNFGVYPKRNIYIKYDNDAFKIVVEPEDPGHSK